MQIPLSVVASLTIHPSFNVPSIKHYRIMYIMPVIFLISGFQRTPSNRSGLWRRSRNHSGHHRLLFLLFLLFRIQKTLQCAW
jgi:hypothetical protein